ncbi:MAG TPA: ATPase domain-containing protein [Polyangia bacterium]|nr:ATPase domain-containing protein [Polyangia bacterium]
MTSVDNSPAMTGVVGLDSILRGGLPRGRLFLIEGDPGVGKTTLALQFLMEGVRLGERVIYVTLSETTEEIHAVAASHEWSLDGIHIYELTPPDALTSDEQNTLFHPSEVELAETMRGVIDLCTRIKPHRVVLDSLSEIRLLAQSPLRYRREVLALKQYFAGRGCTVLLLDDRTGPTGDAHLQSLAHGVLSLDQLAPLYGAHRRRLRVAKLRGVSYRGGYHDFEIQRGGLRVFPRLVASEHARPFERGIVPSGIAGLDAMLDGGLDRGTSTLLLGPAGTGKSSIATLWASSMVARGERVAMYAFDEGLATLFARAHSLGYNLRRHVDAGQMVARQIDPAEMPPGKFADDVREAVEAQGVGCVIIDSLNGYLNAMPDESFLVLQLHELLTFLAQQGVLTIVVVSQHGLVGSSMQSPTDVSYLADTVLLLRHFEFQGELKKAISVLKKRTGRHENTIRELLLDAAGVNVGDPLQQFQGVLTGVPRLGTSLFESERNGHDGRSRARAQDEEGHAP